MSHFLIAQEYQFGSWQKLLLFHPVEFDVCDLVTISELMLFLIRARYLQKYPI